MRVSSIVSAAAIFGLSTVHANVPSKRAVENGPCTGPNSAPGVCIPTAKCTAGGGTFISNACPGTPNDIKCCSKTSCGTGGNCRWTNTCTGTSVSDQCPGPAGFKCCQPTPGGGGGTGPYPKPRIPPVGSCKQVSVNAANAVVAAFPGHVREIYCIRDCSCPGTSDHCCGLALDLMCSSAGGVRTETGRPMAEWFMRNSAAQKVKYVIWGQKIWNPDRDDVKPWTEWRGMEDRGDNTANHWDHVHVSYRG